MAQIPLLSKSAAIQAAGTALAEYEALVSPSALQTKRYNQLLRFFSIGTMQRARIEGLTSNLNIATNDAPVLTAIGAKSVEEEVLLTFDAAHTDADSGDTFVYSIENAEDGMAIVPSTGVFTWTPPADSAEGSPYVVRVRVTDDKGGTDFEDVTITVTAPA